MIDFNKMEQNELPNFHNGNGIIKTNMFFDGKNKIMRTVIEKGCSIGLHEHSTSSEIIYILSGVATFTLDDKQEILKVGDVHYCPKGSKHAVVNNNDGDLIMFCVVPEQ